MKRTKMKSEIVTNEIKRFFIPSIHLSYFFSFLLFIISIMSQNEDNDFSLPLTNANQEICKVDSNEVKSLIKQVLGTLLEIVTSGGSSSHGSKQKLSITLSPIVTRIDGGVGRKSLLPPPARKTLPPPPKSSKNLS